ncbi:MAG TPA: DUF6390 family protein [Candidatus Limnocylindrales bacterium]
MNRTPGPILFARYAYAPNSLGYCGPADHQALLEYAASGTSDGGLRQLARGFEGAYPYLELIARASRLADPLDARVVEAYWLGNDLLDEVDMRTFGAALGQRFRRRAGSRWGFLAEAVPAGAVPNHAFHVFGVYPWIGLLNGDRRDTPLAALDRCRIRWGQVISVNGDTVAVRSRPLLFDGRRLTLGPPRAEVATRSLDGVGLAGELAAGEWVSLHWHWVCDRLTPRQLVNLRAGTLRQLQISNELVSHPPAATVLG